MDKHRKWVEITGLVFANVSCDTATCLCVSQDE